MKKTKYFIISIIVLILDQLSKFYIQFNIPLHDKVEIIENFFYITYVINTGAAWSILEGHQILLAGLAIIVSIGLIYYLGTNMNNSKILDLALSFMIGGAIGNLLDRIICNGVRDFLDFYIFGYNFPVFNLADSFLCAGVFLFIVDTIYQERKHG